MIVIHNDILGYTNLNGSIVIPLLILRGHVDMYVVHASALWFGQR